MAISKIEKLLEIINEMNKKGIPLSKIRNNLKQLGLKEKQIDVLLSKAEIQPTTSEIQEAVTSIDKKISSGEATKPFARDLKKNTEDTSKTRKEVKNLKEDFETHKRKLDEIHKLVLGISSNGKTAPEGSTASLETKIDDLTLLMQEIRPVLKSIDSSTKKMLELNRKVLMKR